MTWFSKVKNWWKGLFKKEEPKQEVVEVAIPTIVEEAEVVKETELSKKAKEVRALGPSDLEEAAVVVKKECDHILSFRKQTWVRISDKKFELQNEMACTKCDSRKVLPIG